MSQVEHAGRRRRHAYLLTAALILVLLSTAPVVGREVGHPGARAPTVYGGIQPDLAFGAEVPAIGREHACEHLQGRKWGHAHQASPRTSEAHEVAALSGTTPAEIGSWSTAVNPGTKTIGISAVLLHTGEVFCFGGKYASTDKNTAAYLYDPVTRTGHEVPAPAAIFCGSVTQLSDGRMGSAGGADPVPKGIVDLWLFDPVTERWSEAAGHSARALLPDLDETRRRSNPHRGRPSAGRPDEEPHS